MTKAQGLLREFSSNQIWLSPGVNSLLRKDQASKTLEFCHVFSWKVPNFSVIPQKILSIYLAIVTILIYTIYVTISLT